MKEVERAYCFGLVRPSIRSSVRHAFETSHIFAKILKFHICIAYEKLATRIFSFLQDFSW